MGNFTVGNGLVIEKNEENYTFHRKTENFLYFDSLDTSEIVRISGPDFFAQIQEGEIKVLESFSNDKQIIYGKNSHPNFPDPDSLSTKQEFLRQWRMQFVLEFQSIGIFTADQAKIEGELPDVDKIIRAKFPDEMVENQKRPGVSSICRWIKKYKESEYNAQALTSKKRKKYEKRHALSDKSEEIADKAIDEVYMCKNRRGPSAVHDRYEELTKEDNLDRKREELPPIPLLSKRTLERRIYAIPEQERLIARYGKREAERYLRMSKGHLQASYPLDVVEIDSTPVNLFVIDDEAMMPLGRPTLTIIVDRYSKAIIGMFASFSGEKLESVFGAIKHSLYPPHRFKERFPDLQNDWLGGGVARRYVTDNGSAYQSPHFRRAVVEIGATYEYCKSFTPWQKPNVERTFLTYESLLEAMPGYTFSSVDQRFGCKPEKDAVVRFSTFIYLLHKWVVDVANVSPARRNGARSIDLWMDGIESNPPMYPSSTGVFDTAFGIHDIAAVTHEGITRSYLHYASDELHALRRRYGTKLKVDIRKNLSNLGAIQVLNPETNQYFSIPCTRPDYANGLSQLQHDVLRKTLIEQNRVRSNVNVDNLIRTKAQIRETIGEEIERASTIEKMKFAKLSGINSSTVIDGKPATILPTEDQIARSPLVSDRSWDDMPAYDACIRE